MLYEALMTPCVYMVKTRVPDGMGGWTDSWSEGMRFNAAITKDNTLQARVAEKQGVSELYTITTDKQHPLDFHDVLKRKTDGTIFRVTSNTRDSQSPEFSIINFGQVSAEVWKLT